MRAFRKTQWFLGFVSALLEKLRLPTGSRRYSRLETCATIVAAFVWAGCAEPERVVVVYTSQDQVYAEPLLADFTKKTGIKVLPVFDNESVKTAGLVQRLIAEKNNPRADVFWSNEEMMYRQLVDRGVLDSNHWTTIGTRTRRLVVNTNHVAMADVPRSLRELTNAKWAGKVAMAYPIYGTTAGHMARLREAWGDAKWKEWCEAMAASKPMIVDGNSVVVKLVGAGEAWIGLTDSDDVAAGLRNGLPIAAAPIPDEFKDEFLCIPNSVGLVTGAPHREAAMAFFEFAQSRETRAALVKVNAIENADGYSNLSISRPIEETQGIVKTIFARK